MEQTGLGCHGANGGGFSVSFQVAETTDLGQAMLALQTSQLSTSQHCILSVNCEALQSTKRSLWQHLSNHHAGELKSFVLVSIVLKLHLATPCLGLFCCIAHAKRSAAMHPVDYLQESLIDSPGCVVGISWRHSIRLQR